MVGALERPPCRMNGPKVFYILMIPAILYVVSGLLSGRAQGPIDPYRALFEQNRKAFFALFIVYLANGALSPWMFGIVPLGELAPVQASTLPATAIATAGLASKSPRTLVVLGLAIWALSLAALVPTPIRRLAA